MCTKGKRNAESMQEQQDTKEKQPNIEELEVKEHKLCRLVIKLTFYQDL